MARWWFVRHGESVANAGGWLAGHQDALLTERGVEQAKALKGELRGLAPDRVWSSDLERAWRTASFAWDHRLPPCRRHPELRERSVGAWEGVAFADLPVDAPELLCSWRGRPPGGESHQDLSVRVLTFLAAHDDGGDTLVFSHGGLMRAILGLVDTRPLEVIGHHKIGNVELLTREVASGTWRRLLDALTT